MTRTARRLPHIYARGWPLFVTFRLHDTLPLQRAFPTRAMTSGRAFVAIAASGHRSAAMDRILDQARCGPSFLRRPAVAQQVLDSIQYGANRGDYKSHAWVIMPNHVHLLLTPEANVSKLLGSLKAGSAKRANLLLGRAGRPFWQDESYDHLVRTDDEFERIRRYIEHNPVTAGLVLKPEDYAWSSAGRPARPPQAGACPTNERSLSCGPQTKACP